MRRWFLVCSCLLVPTLPTSAEVTNVTIESRAVVADGHSFGATGTYERSVGRIEFALDPAAPQNARIVDLAYAPRGADGRVHFSADLHVLQPTDPAKGNGVLLFEVPNRGNRVLPRFNNAGARGTAALAEFGDGLLMRDGYTLVAVGWELGLSAPQLGVSAPPAILPAGSVVEPIEVDVVVDARTTESLLIDERARPPVIYPPADGASSTDRLTVRDLFWDDPVVIAARPLAVHRGFGRRAEAAARRRFRSRPLVPRDLSSESSGRRGRRSCGVSRRGVRVSTPVRPADPWACGLSVRCFANRSFRPAVPIRRLQRR